MRGAFPSFTRASSEIRSPKNPIPCGRWHRGAVPRKSGMLHASAAWATGDPASLRAHFCQWLCTTHTRTAGMPPVVASARQEHHRRTACQCTRTHAHPYVHAADARPGSPEIGFPTARALNAEILAAHSFCARRRAFIYNSRIVTRAPVPRARNFRVSRARELGNPMPPRSDFSEIGFPNSRA